MGLRRPRKRYFAVALAALGILVYAGLTMLAKPAADHPFFAGSKFWVMVHRGGAGLWPEGTVYAFRKALELGADVLEMDIRATKDGELVVIHDETVDATTDGTGPVSGIRLEELKKLDAGYRWTNDGGASFPYRGRGITIPTLREVFDAFPDARMNVEIKARESSVVAKLAEVIRRAGKGNRVLVVCQEKKTIEEFRRLCPEVATGASRSEATSFYALTRCRLESLSSPKANALQVPEYSGKIHVVTRRFVEAAHKRNLKVHVWTINDPDDMKRLIDLGVDGIITDYPDRLMEVLGR